VNEDVRRAFAFMGRADIAGTRTQPFRWGTAVFDDDLPLRYDSNYLLLEREPDGDEALVREADRVQGGSGLAHRAIVVPDERLGVALEPFFRGLPGWKVERFLVMVHRRPVTRLAGSAVQEVDGELLRQPRTAALLGYPWGTEELARTLADSKARIADPVRTRFFAVLDDGEPVSWTDLYSADGVAQLEDLATAPAHRGRGHATAVVLRALEAARADGAGFVFLVADEEDWPKELYAKLGFDPAGRFSKFLRLGGRTAVSGAASAAPSPATAAS
jgi:ribosomal protein S18 acetylase RimI-like enzyme